jgi:hypothetical protein
LEVGGGQKATSKSKGGLPWLNNVDIRGAKPEGGIYIFFKLILFFWFSSWAQAAPQSSARSRATRKNKKFKNKYFFIFYFFIFPPSGLALRMSAGLSHGSPPFDFEVAFCPPPTSYLLPLLLYKTPHESYFSPFFALTFGKPLNYFTCEKEDF